MTGPHDRDETTDHQGAPLADYRAVRLRLLQLLLLAAELGAANYARSALAPLQESVRIALSIGDNRMAALQGPALALPVLLSAIPVGVMVDRYSRKMLLVGFLGLMALGTVLTAISSGFLALMGARSLVGFAASATSITVLALVADLYDVAHRGRANMIVTAGEVLGASSAFAIAGFLLARLPEGAQAWRSAILLMTVPIIVLTFLAALVDEPRRTAARSKERRIPAQESLVALWRERRVVATLLIGKTIVAVGYVAVVSWSAPMFSRTFGLSPARVGQVMSGGLLLAGLAGPMLGGFSADLCERSGGPRRTILLLSALASVSVPLGCFAIMPGAMWAAVMLVAFMVIVSLMGVVEVTLTTVLIPASLRGLCLSVLVAAGLVLGVGLGPLCVSVLAGWLGGAQRIGEALTLLCSSLGAIGIATFWAARGVVPGPRTRAT